MQETFSRSWKFHPNDVGYNNNTVSDGYNHAKDDDGSTDLKRQHLEMRLYRTTRRLMIISQVFLCAPTAVHKPKIPEGCAGKCLYYLHLIWFIGLYVGLVACVYDEYTSSNIELPTVQKPLYFSEYLVYLIHLLEIMFSIYLGRENFWKFFAFIVDFDLILADLKVSHNYKGLKYFLQLHLSLIVVHFICTLVVGYFYSDGILLNFLRTSAVYIIPNIIIQISLIHYYALLYVTAERSDKLYHVLDKILLNAKFCGVSALRQQLHFIRSLYAKLEQFTRDINDAFSYSIVLVYVGSFINISVNIFLLYKYFNNWSNSDLAWIAYSAVWTCMHIGKMTLILYYNENVQSKVS